MHKKKQKYKKLSPAAIGKIHKEKVKGYFECSLKFDLNLTNITVDEVEWAANLVKDEVRKAIRIERGLE